MKLDSLTTAQAETAEAEIMYRYVASARDDTTAELGIAVTRIGGGVVLSAAKDVTGYWSKALGFGVTEPVTEVLIDRVIEFYGEVGSPGAVLQIAPEVLPTGWPGICRRHRLRADSEWVKLGCAIGEIATTAHDERVAPVSEHDVDEWARTTLMGFGMPTAGLADMLAASAADPQTRQFAAWNASGRMVATANMLIHGEVAALSAAATLPEHRNQGLQSALIAVRATAAAAAGCRWVVAETGWPADGETNASLNNLRRAGLRPLYLRRNWVWTP